MPVALHVLMIEDSESDAELMLHNLEKAGYLVVYERVETAAAMNAALKKPGWQIVISDYSLPSFSAPDALQVLIESGLDIPFIVVSGTITEETAIELMRAGAADYLMKDRLARLAPLVRRELNIAQVRRERNETRAALEKSQEKFSTAFRLSPDAININRLSDGLYMDVNEGFTTFSGYTAEEVLGKTSFEINLWVDPQDRIRWTRALREFGEVSNHEIVYRIKNGSMRTCLVSARIIDVNGEACILAITRDITERKQIEDTLKEDELYLRTILQTIKEGFWILDASGKVLDANEAYCEMSGYSLSELKRMRITDLAALEDAAETSARFERVLKNGSERFETHQRRKDGSIIDVEISATFLPEEGGRFICFCRDISERKQAEESLRLTQAKFYTAFKVSPDSININRLRDGLFLEINEGFKNLTGYTDDEILGKTSLEINIWVNPQDRTRLVQELRENGQVTNLEAPFRAKDGTIKVCLMSARVIEINGEACILSITRDISERKQAEQALRMSESRYRAIFDHGPDGVVILNPETGQLIDFNDTACRQLGYSREEFGKLSVADIEVAESEVEVNRHIQAIVAQGRDDFETRQRTKQGEIRNIHVTAQLIERGEHPIYHCIWRDITGRILAEAALRESEAKLKKAQLHAHLGSWSWNIKASKLDWSDEMFRIFGVEKATFTGSLEDVIAQSIHPDDRSKIDASNLSVLEKKRPVPLEYRVIWPDQTVHTVWAEAGELILDEAGNPAILNGIVQDITERKQAENKINDQLNELRRWYKISLGREGRILELKNEINRMLIQSGHPPRYPSALEDSEK
jgi:PAS domain S-box-containing protein